MKPVPEGQQGTLEVKIDERTGEAAATCTAEGVKTGLGGLEGTLLSASGLDVEVVDAQGVAVPPPAEMTPGKSWANKLAVKMRPPESVKLPGNMRPIISTTFEKESTVIGPEELTTPAGTFQTLKVKNRTTARGSARGEGRSVDSFAWFAEGVGLVKVMTGDSVDLELQKLERPQAPAATKKPARARRATSP